MAEHERKSPGGTQAVEEIRRKRKTLEPVPERLKAQGSELNPFSAILESPMGEPSVERHAALLGDARFSHPANAEQKARMMSELQQNYGNAYVQRVVGHIQAKRDDQLSDQELPGDIAQTIAGQRGSGQPLDPETRSQMEASFGRDFGDVRVHTDATAHRLARVLRARAFTTGKDIFFKGGAYELNSESGTRLIAHELTHVVQQERAAGTEKVSIGHLGDASEREAEGVAKAARVRRPVTVEKFSKVPGLQRQAEPAPGVPTERITFTEEEAGVIYAEPGKAAAPAPTEAAPLINPTAEFPPVEVSTPPVGPIKTPLVDIWSSMKLKVGGTWSLNKPLPAPEVKANLDKYDAEVKAELQNEVGKMAIEVGAGGVAVTFCGKKSSLEWKLTPTGMEGKVEGKKSTIKCGDWKLDISFDIIVNLTFVGNWLAVKAVVIAAGVAAFLAGLAAKIGAALAALVEGAAAAANAIMAGIVIIPKRVLTAPPPWRRVRRGPGEIA